MSFHTVQLTQYSIIALLVPLIHPRIILYTYIILANVSTNIISIASVAVDWINSKIYWTDENASRIEVAELSGSNRKVLFDTNMQHPRDLTIDPTTRYCD